MSAIDAKDPDTKDRIATIAAALVVRPKGILAADETPGTIGKRFEKVGIESTPETRAAYRSLLCSTPGLENYISGVILQDETIRQRTPDGVPIVKILESKGILAGIKIDLGLTDLPSFPGEKITGGLDGLADRATEYADMGATFAKWRAVFSIDGAGTPSKECIDANAHSLARYAATCQAAGLVPIVEPEILIEGEHSGATCAGVTVDVLQAVFRHLANARVSLDAIVLKPSMVVAGTRSLEQMPPAQVAEATVACLQSAVPPEVAGIAFLSGGQSPELATTHLSAMNRLGRAPWNLTFSFGRALQDPVLTTWAGDEANIAAAQHALLHRSRCASAATRGEYDADMETAA